MRRTRGIKDLITGKAVLLPQPLWFMEEIANRYDKLAEEAKKTMDLREQQIRDRACTVCDGLRPYGKGFRAVSKIRCDTCTNGKNWNLL